MPRWSIELIGASRVKNTLKYVFVSNGNRLVMVGRTSKEVDRVKHELVRSYWPVLAYICIFPLGNAYSVKCACEVTQVVLALLLNNAMFRNVFKGSSLRNVVRFVHNRL